MPVDISLIIGGPQGGGIESAGQVAVRTFAFKGYDVYGVREYHSNIIGAHSYFNLRARDRVSRSVKLPVDGVVALDAESVLTHMDDVKRGGFLVYDSASTGVSVDKIAPMPPPLKERVKAKLSSLGLPATVAGALEYLKSRDVTLVGIPLKQFVRHVAEETGRSIVSVSRTANTMGLAVAMALLGVELEKLEKAIQAFFAGKKKVIEPNIVAARMAYEYAKETVGAAEPLPDGPFKGRKRVVGSGNDFVAMGKVAGGLTVQTYYPITPAADEALYMEAHRLAQLTKEAAQVLGLTKAPVVVFQAEDEIAAINMAIGAALAGARAATTTSGPGLSLMNEAISMAVMMEVPVVITVWQRAGPSTGMATRTGQQDLLHAVFSGHGDTPKIVIASGDHEEAFYDAIKALNWAERYQTPVIHLLDKTIASGIKTLDLFSLEGVVIDRGKLVDKVEGEYRRYKLTEDGISPRAPLGVATQLDTSLEHLETGSATEDPVVREQMMRKRMKKMEVALSEIPDEDKAVLHGDPDAKVTILSWGSPKGAILDAMETLAAEGVKVNFLQLRLFAPFPADYVKKLLEGSEKIIALEANAVAQAAQLVRMHTGIEVDHRILKLTGRSVHEHEVVYAVKRILETGEKEVVVSDGA